MRLYGDTGRFTSSFKAMERQHQGCGRGPCLSTFFFSFPINWARLVLHKFGVVSFTEGNLMRNALCYGVRLEINTAILDPNRWCAIPAEMQSANTGVHHVWPGNTAAKFNQCRDMPRFPREDAECKINRVPTRNMASRKTSWGSSGPGEFNLLLRRSKRSHRDEDADGFVASR